MTTAKTTNTKKAATKATGTGTRAKKTTGTTSAQQPAALIPDIATDSPTSAADSAANDGTTAYSEQVLVTVQQDALTKAIETVSASIPQTQGHAALLDRLRLTTNQAGQTLTLSGFNLIVGMEVTIAANVEGSGDWTVAASKLLNLLRNFPSGPVTLSWTVGKTLSIVSRTAGPFEVTTRLADDCPAIPVPEAPQRFTLIDFQWGLKGAILCAGAEDFRCVHMLFWADTQATEDAPLKAGVTLTSTKKEALLVFYHDVPDGTDLELPDRTASVAGESLRRLVGLLGDQRCEVELDTVSTEDVVVRFVLTPTSKQKLVTETPTGVTTIVTCRTDKVEAMNGSGFMPPDPLPVEISVDRHQMIAALQRQAVITNKTAAVTLNVGSNEVTLTSEGAGSDNGTDTLSAQVQGAPMTIKFSPDFLLECLQALQSNQARLSFSGSTEAAYIRDSERETLFFVLAPAG